MGLQLFMGVLLENIRRARGSGSVSAAGALGMLNNW
jgi:hypothetical protein